MASESEAIFTHANRLMLLRNDNRGPYLGQRSIVKLRIYTTSFSVAFVHFPLCTLWLFFNHEGHGVFTDNHRVSTLHKFHLTKKLRQMKIRFGPVDIVPGEVMRARKIIAAFVKVHAAILSLDSPEIVVAKNADRYCNG